MMQPHSPRIKHVAVDKRRIVVVADVVSGFHLSAAHFRNHVSVHDYIRYHRAGVALGGGEEQQDDAADEHCSLDKVGATSRWSCRRSFAAWSSCGGSVRL